MKPVIFVDRDGTLIEEGEYMRDAAQVKILPGVATALKRLRRAGFTVVVVSNQSGVGRGLVTREEMRRVDRRFRQVLREKGAKIDGCYYCPHAPSKHCPCRKPMPGLLKRASRELHVPWRGGISIGDRPSDVQLAQRAGGLGILVRTGYGNRWARRPGAVKPEHIARDFAAAADWILKKYRKEHRHEK